MTYTCERSAAVDAEVELLVKHGVLNPNDERLLPHGGECQCAKCGWLFGGLTGFDRHVSKSHADPLSLGLVARFRSDAVVWVQEYISAG